MVYKQRSNNAMFCEQNTQWTTLKNNEDGSHIASSPVAVTDRRAWHQLLEAIKSKRSPTLTVYSHISWRGHRCTFFDDCRQKGKYINAAQTRTVISLSDETRWKMRVGASLAACGMRVWAFTLARDGFLSAALQNAEFRHTQLNFQNELNVFHFSLSHWMQGAASVQG